MRRFACLVALTLASAGCAVESDTSGVGFGSASTNGGGSSTTGQPTDTGGTTDPGDDGDASGTGTGDSADDGTTGTDTTDTTDATGGANCGNGVIEGSEQCDGSELGGAVCGSANASLPQGDLLCNSDCTFNTDSCYSCGDGVRQTVEACDGNDFNGQTCQSLGFASGNLVCESGCLSVSTAGCQAAATCGNGSADTNEDCDGTDLGGQTCTGLGFANGGVLQCNGDCTYNTVNCSTGSSCAGFFQACNPLPPALGGVECCAGFTCALLICVPE